jgi:hypothetical protein
MAGTCAQETPKPLVIGDVALGACSGPRRRPVQACQPHVPGWWQDLSQCPHNRSVLY